MKTQILAALVILMLGCSGLFADNLTWGGTYIANWDGFGTSPYTANDTSVNPNQGIQLFCLDFNDEIAPPDAWTAGIMTLNTTNVASSAQYGGNYNNLLTAAYNSSHPSGETAAPQVGSPAFTGDTPAGGSDAVSLSQTTSAYQRYLEAAWLFTDIQTALLQHPQDTNTDMIAQVAAWDLFVNASNLGTLTSDIKNYGGTYTFNNYPGNTATSGLTFEQAVDVALTAAQDAVVNDGWSPGPSWSLVTGTPTYVVGYGRAVQEFLSPNAPVPEPQGLVLLGTVIAIWMMRRRLGANEKNRKASA